MTNNDAKLINEWVSRSGASPSEGLGSIGLTHAIPAGHFYYGSRFHPREAPRREMTLPDYEIAHAPVLVKQFAVFVEDGGYANPQWWSQNGWAWRHGLSVGWGRENRALPAEWNSQKHRGDHPVTGLTVHEAEAYCAWLSVQKKRRVRLPTEEEWERAARGDDGRPWPWGAQMDEVVVNTLERGLNTTTPVGSLPADVSPCGALDMGGNVQEWTASPYTPRPEERFASADLRVARGGSFNDTAFGARTSYRRGYPAGYFFPFLGFRVVVALR